MRWLAGALALLPGLALAQAADPVRWQLNMHPGVTPTSHAAYTAHMWVLWICVAIGVLVFGAMAYAMFAFRKSRGAVAAQWSHNTVAEVIWTVVPIAILVALAFPASKNLIKMYDVRDASMTIKVTGYQWMWKYDYLDSGVSFTSRLERRSDELRQSGAVPSLARDPHYLLDVDHPLVVPVGTKIRFVLTADDVIHAWWVPALGWKQDAIPGIINEAWAKVDQPGVYRGQCAELCGKDHGFMPIVVKAVPQAEFDQWLAAEKARAAPAPVAAPVQPATPATPAAPAEAPATAAAPAAAVQPASAG